MNGLVTELALLGICCLILKEKFIALLARSYTLFRVVASLGHPLLNVSASG